MRWLLLVLGLVWLALVPVPAFSQASHGGSSSAQYDQYPSPGSGVGGRAAHDAIVASGAIQAGTQASEENAASAAEAPDESTVRIEELPETGGPSPYWFGVPMIGAGVLLARRILFSQ
jgi:hypothetical protein